MNAKVAALVVAILLAVGVAAWMLLGGGAGAFGRADRDGSQETAAGDSSGISGSAGSRGVARAGAAPSGNAPPRVLPPRPASGESTVVGAVVEAGTRAPIPEAEIVLRHPQAEFAVLATSRADGKFTLDRVPGVVGARVFVSAKGFGPRLIRDVHVPPHDRLDLGAIELARGVPIEGIVVTGLGAPLAGAQVDLIETPALAPGSFENLVSLFRELRDDDEALDQVLTAADGTFRFQGAAPGKYVAFATKPGWQVRYSRPFTVEPGLGPSGLTIRLVEGRALRGVVKDEAGNPVAGAAVAALEIDFQNIFLVKSQKTVTSREGRFSYACFGGGDVSLIVSAPGYSGTSKGNLKAGGNDVEVVLRKAARIEGRVYDRATGKGLPDAVVVAIQLGLSIALEESRTGPEGEYVIEAAPTGDKVSVFAKLPGYAMAELIEPPAGREDKPPWEALERDEVATGAVMKRDIPMIGGGSLSGRVVDEASSEGIAGADVIVQASDGLAFLGCNDPVTTRSTSDGTFSLTKLGAGKVTARAEASGYVAPQDIPRTSSDADSPEEPEPPPAAAEIRPGGAVTGIVIKLRRGAEIDVLVTDPAGAPMADARVSWVMPGEELGNGFGPAKRPRLVATDSAGRARLRGVTRIAGIVIAARHQAFPAGSDVTIDVTSPPREPVKIVLTQGASVAGVVLDVDGKPAADRSVVYKPSHGDVARAFGEWAWDGHRVVADAAGRFLFENMPCGEGTFDVEEKRAPNDSGASFNRERQDYLEDAERAIVLVAGKREEVRLQLLPTLEIAGRVFDAAGQPAAGIGVNVSSQKIPWGAGSAITAADGSYRIGGLVAGEYSVQVRAGGQAVEVGGAPAPPDGELLTKTVAAGSRAVDFRFTK